MLINHELIRKLRIGAFALSAFLGGYATLTFIDHTIHTVRLVLILLCVIVSIVSAWMLRKPAKTEFIAYAVSTLLIVPMLMFRLRDNIALDISLFGLIVGIIVTFGLQLRKSNGFA